MTKRATHKALRFSMPLVLSFFLLVPYQIALCYVMPASQVLELMAKNFSPMDTMVIEQWVKVSEPGSQDDEDLVPQSVRIRRPWSFSCEKLQGPERSEEGALGTGCGWCDVGKYQCMFIKHSVWELEAFASRLGIDTSIVSLTHLGEKIAYLIGRKGKGRSYLIVDRDSFLPLELHVGFAGSSVGPFTIRFKDYRHIGHGWFPYRIICESDYGLREEFVVQNIETGINANPSILQSPAVPSESKGLKGSPKVPGE